MYVTLEPCNHYGKTPPCAQFLFENGISNIIIGTLDPNPTVCGNGIKTLKNFGLNVINGVFEVANKFILAIIPWR